MITKADIDKMSPEELEQLRHKASVAIFKRFALLFVFKLSVALALRRLAKRLEV